MKELVHLQGSGKAELTLFGVTDTGESLYALGYFLVDPKRKRVPLPGAPPFLNLTIPKPYRRGCVFRAETGEKYKNVEPLTLDKVFLYAVTLPEEIRMERIHDDT